MVTMYLSLHDHVETSIQPVLQTSSLLPGYTHVAFSIHFHVSSPHAEGFGIAIGYAEGLNGS